MQGRLLAWFDRNRRDLPWRKTRDPWAIWVSEVMLQQTRVEAVRDAFERFVASFPTPAAFATASDDALLLAWRGLGYYRRARLLREAARAVVRDHAGRVPADTAALGDLPGIGEYTRGAIASIAFGKPEIAVDGNVERVVARHRGILTDVKREPAAAQVRATVRTWQDPRRPGDFNQALMELGATVCTPKAPRCLLCPLTEDCEARRRGLTDRLPVLPQRRAPTPIAARCALVVRPDGAVLGARIADGEINAGQIEVPTPGALVDCTSGSELARQLGERFGVAFTIGAELCSVRHTITHHRIVLTAHEAACRARKLPEGLAWHPPDSAAVPWSTLARKVFAARGIVLPRNVARG